jgi:hypothetical protein
MPATLDDTIKANPMIVVRQMSGGAVLMNTMSGDFFELNAVGARVWDAIGRGTPLPALVDDLSRAYTVQRETVAGDLLSLVDELARRGLVTLAAE